MKVKIVQISKQAEKLIERAARKCYNSEKNMKDIPNGKFISNLITHKHTSVLEHAYITFEVDEVSRSLLQQLARHRVGISLSVQSQRYVSQDNFTYVTPLSIRNSEHIMQYHAFMDAVNEFYNEMISTGIKKEDARYILPAATVTTFLITFNFRSLLHFLELRLDKHAQWEIRKLATIFLKQIKVYAPNVFKSQIEEHLN